MGLETIRAHAKALRLPTIAEGAAHTLGIAQREDWPLETFLEHLLTQEMIGRRERRITRLTTYLRERRWRSSIKLAYLFACGVNSHSSARARSSSARRTS